MQRNSNESKSSSENFTHAIIDAIFKYILHMKTKKHSYEDNNIGVLRHIKVYYGCYETRKNGSLMKLQIPTHSCKHYMMMNFFKNEIIIRNIDQC
jgi:hypothetical protein